MKRNGLLALAFALAAPLSAQALTFDDFIVSTGGGNGSVTDSGAAPGFDLGFFIEGSDNGTNTAVLTSLIATAPADANVFFEWRYETDDDEASYDPFGYVLGGVFADLTDPRLSEQNGSFSFAVTMGQSFGWYIRSVDDIGNRAFASVDVRFDDPTDLTASAVPLPAAAPLLAAALGALGFARRSRSRREA